MKGHVFAAGGNEQRYLAVREQLDSRGYISSYHSDLSDLENIAADDDLAAFVFLYPCKIEAVTACHELNKPTILISTTRLEIERVRSLNAKATSI